jgi:ketosteroid isomerase-like protein
MKRCALLGAVLLSLCLGANAAVQDEAIQAEKAWAAAVTKRDFAALDKLLADELIYTHSSAVVEDKKVYFGRLKSGVQKYDVLEHGPITAKVYGDTAILHYRIRMRGVSDGAPFDTRAVVTHVWVKQNGAWKLAAHQATKLP